MTPVRAVLLDAAGTLLELEPPGPKLHELLRLRFGVPLDAEQTRAAFAAEIAYYRAHMLEGSDPDRLDDLRRRCAEVLRAALPASAALAEVSTEQLVLVLLDALVFKAFAEVPGVLGRLRAAGIGLVVASNWDCSLPAVLERAGLLELVDAVVCSAVIGVAKPDPGLIEAALSAAGVAPEEAVHVGDSYTEDVGAARGARVRAVWVDRTGRDGELSDDAEVVVVDSLATLPGLLGI